MGIEPSTSKLELQFLIRLTKRIRYWSSNLEVDGLIPILVNYNLLINYFLKIYIIFFLFFYFFFTALAWSKIFQTNRIKNSLHLSEYYLTDLSMCSLIIVYIYILIIFYCILGKVLDPRPKYYQNLYM